MEKTVNKRIVTIMKSTAYLQDESILTLLALNNLIVPEIQRDYVWGKNIDVLSKFISDIKNYAVKCDACKRVHSMKNNNIGFLYSYKPPYQELERGRYLDEFLIDGQQRITTVFLLLLSRAVAENRIRDFKNICRVHEDGFAECFNYKVREISQTFMESLLKHVINVGDETALDFIYKDDRPSWFLSDFEQDPTAASICKSLKIINESFKDDVHLYFDFLLENIHFWHFKTEITTQGEELYISMNSTGEQLVQNEIEKAKIISRNNQIDLGQRWEEWQNLFWWHRTYGKDTITERENADKGFNNYINCIHDLEHKLSQGAEIDYELYINALCLVTNSSYKVKTMEQDVLVDKLKELDLPTEWLNDFRNKLWNILNAQAWSIGEKPTDAANQKTMLFWPWMYYIKCIHTNLEDHYQDLLRIIHLFYIRYYCDKRDYRKIFNVVNSICSNNYAAAFVDCDVATDEVDDDNLFYEEEIKLQALYSNNHEYEKVIWKIQNVPVIRDGSNCGGNTVMSFYHKLSASNEAGQILDFLENIYDAEKLQPKIDPNILRSLLLFYSIDETKKEDVFWHVKSDGKYFAKEWKRIVRNNAFWRFYDENRDKNIDFEDLLKEKRDKFFNEKTLNYDSPLPRFEKAIIYDALCYIKDGDSIWWIHGNVGFGRDTYTSRQTLFVDKDELYRIKEYMWYNRYNLPTNWQEILQKKYPSVSFINYPANNETNPDSAEEHNLLDTNKENGIRIGATNGGSSLYYFKGNKNEGQECIDINQFMEGLESLDEGEMGEVIRKEMDRVRNKILFIEDEIEEMKCQIAFLKEDLNKAEDEDDVHSLKDEIDDYEDEIFDHEMQKQLLDVYYNELCKLL